MDHRVKGRQCHELSFWKTQILKWWLNLIFVEWLTTQGRYLELTVINQGVL